MQLKVYKYFYLNYLDSKEFKDFVQKAKDKGYFGSLAEDSSDYKEKYQKLLEKYSSARTKSTKSQEPPPPSSSKPVITPEKKAEADKYKEEGNQLLKANKYKEAYDSYTKAIETNSDGEGSHIYYSNRAAASMYLNNYDDAINDCKKALEIDPTFIRALTRLAKAYIYENKYVDAEECLERAKRLDSDNTEVKNLMNEVKEKRSSENGGSSAGSGAAPGGFPNIPNLDNLGGLGGLGDLLNNPAIRSVAENLMQNPDLMNMASSAMQNPNFLNMMSGMMNKNGGGGGGSNNSDSNQ